jgi:hypothetical protein
LLHTGQRDHAFPGWWVGRMRGREVFFRKPIFAREGSFKHNISIVFVKVLQIVLEGKPG